ncbi:hypothetical protein [Aliarcobacter cryaerophilus]|uniref:hypothetical protein n=1 Tax=Aliarcobacter cryaerophilus TaxID=28198 RepID=UPI003DA5BC67
MQKKEIPTYIRIGKTKLDEIIESGKFIKPVYIDGFAYGLYSLNEIQEWIELQKQKRNLKTN